MERVTIVNLVPGVGAWLPTLISCGSIPPSSRRSASLGNLAMIMIFSRAACGRIIFWISSLATSSLVTMRWLAPMAPTHLTVTCPWMSRLSMRMWATVTGALLSGLACAGWSGEGGLDGEQLLDRPDESSFGSWGSDVGGHLAEV